MKNNNFYSKENKLEAYVYFNNDDKFEIGNDWDLNDWQRRFGLISRLAAKEYMLLQHSCGEIDFLTEYEKIYTRLFIRKFIKHAFKFPRNRNSSSD